MQAENPKLKAALTKARLAEELDSNNDYQQALELYEDALAILISLIDGMYAHSCFCFSAAMMYRSIDISLHIVLYMYCKNLLYQYSWINGYG